MSGPSATAPLVLVGPPGAGKSTLAAALSDAWAVPCVDLDARVTRDGGFDTLTALIAERGLEAFRRAETRALAAVLDEAAPTYGEAAPAHSEAAPATIIATGGGTFANPENRAIIRASGATTVWLDLPTDVARARIEASPRAGLPTDVAELSALLEGRRAAYALADRWLDAQQPLEASVRALTDGRAPAQRVSIRPEAPEPPYDVLLLSGGIADTADALTEAAERLASTLVVVVCERRFEADCERLIERLSARGLPVAAAPVVLAGGERVKTTRGLERLWHALADVGVDGRGLDRSGLVVGVGGGATTDLVGMAAATWMRGVPVALVSTTLLAMADASVGGKTAINLPGGDEPDAPLRKNAVGVFAQPRLVCAPLQTLRTLPTRQWRSGLAEIAKAWLLAVDAEADRRWQLDGGLHDWQEHPAKLAPVLSAAIEVKAAIVAADSRERGPRALLNLGHTAGHALEAAAGGALLHGEAVAAGLLLEARAAARLGWAEPAAVEKVRAALAMFGLGDRAERPPDGTPTRWSPAAAEALAADKKRRGDRLSWPILRAPGRAEVVTCELTTFAAAVAG